VDKEKSIVVQYHFVRNMHETPYPGIKGRLVDDFIGQVGYLCRYHQPLWMRDFIRYFAGECDLPKNGFYLTFDDGIRDHYETVLPVLERHGLEAAFFPILEPLVHGRVSSVDKFRFLTYLLDFDIIYDEFFETLTGLFPDSDVSRWKFNEQKGAGRRWTQFDPPKLGHLKIVANREMPLKMRDAALDALFSKHFGPDADFIQELYVTWEEIIELYSAGMVIGGHTVTHPWLPRLSSEEQAAEIYASLLLLEEKLNTKIKLFSYPYGGYNEDTLRLLRHRECDLAFTSKAGIICYRDKPLEIDRLDTNDLPLSTHTEPNGWSQEVGTKICTLYPGGQDDI